MKTIAFFNNKGGVGKTSLVYHLAWMFADLGFNVIAADFDPQANLSSMFLEENRLEELWPDGDHPDTVFGAIKPILRGTGDIKEEPYIENITEKIGLLVGDLGLSSFEDKLSESWPKCLDRENEAAFRAISAFYRLVESAAKRRLADLVLIDVGPNLGAINRSAIIAAEHIVIPLASDLFSLQGLKNLGPSLRDWRVDWKERLNKKSPENILSLPSGEMNPLGYVTLQHGTRSEKPVQAYQRWMNQIPSVYREAVLDEPPAPMMRVEEDHHCLAMLKHYRSLMPLAMEARKPMFSLKPADGAIGAHIAAVHACYEDFKQLAQNIAEKSGL